MNHKTTILQCGGAWATNIGNAFIDLGSICALQKAVRRSQIALSSNLSRGFLSRGFFSVRSRIFDGAITDSTKNLFDFKEFAKAEYFVFSGSLLNPQWLDLTFPKRLLQKNVKIILNGVGGSLYTKEEFEKVTHYLNQIKPYAFISRDEVAFKHYSGIAEYSFNGIDCGFFVKDYFLPVPIDLTGYITLTFDRIDPPKINQKDRKVIRPHHSCWSQAGFLKKLRSKYGFTRENTLISDLPQDYLNIYSSTEETHADRVHACVPTLAFGKPARLYINTPRTALFDRINAGTIGKKLTSASLERISSEKKKEIKFLSEVLNHR